MYYAMIGGDFQVLLTKPLHIFPIIDFIKSWTCSTKLWDKYQKDRDLRNSTMSIQP